MELENKNSRTFQEQILKNSLFQGFFKNHLKFKKNSQNSRTVGHTEPLKVVPWNMFSFKLRKAGTLNKDMNTLQSQRKSASS